MNNNSSNMKLKLTNFLSRISKQILMIVISIIALYPLFFMVITALKTHQEYIWNKVGLPSHITFANFQHLFSNTYFANWILNSFVLAFGMTILVTSITSLAAFAFAKLKPLAGRTLFNITVSLMVIPPVVVIIPLYIFMAMVGLINTYIALIVIYSGILIPFSIYLLTNFFVTIPQGIIDSAAIDGCTSLQIFYKIILPLSKPVLVTLIVVNTLWVWNELLYALVFLQGDTLRTLMVGITFFKSNYTVNVPLVMTGCLVAAIPIILVYLLGQKYFIRGMIGGAFKGE